MSGDTLETLLAAYLILGPVGAAAGMIIIAWLWLRPRAHEGRIAERVAALSKGDRIGNANAEPDPTPRLDRRRPRFRQTHHSISRRTAASGAAVGLLAKAPTEAALGDPGAKAERHLGPGGDVAPRSLYWWRS